jgi:hypothetical protein
MTSGFEEGLIGAAQYDGVRRWIYRGIRGRDGTIDQTTTSSYMTHSGLDDLLTQETVTDSGGTVTS